jgi:hypothetical protein
MQGEFPTVAGTARWSSSDAGLEIEIRGRVRTLGWQEVTRAGLVQLPGEGPPSDFPVQMLPGLGRLFQLNRTLAQEYRQLVLARGRSSRRMFRMPVPVDEPDAMALVEEVRRHVEERWVGEVPMKEHYKALGVRYPWLVIPLYIAGLIVSIPLCLMSSGAYLALQRGGVAEVPPVAWLVLVLWLILIGWIFYMYRGRI